MTTEREPSEGWKCIQFALSSFLHPVKSAAFQWRKAKIWFLPTLKNLYRLLKRFPVILTHGFLGKMLVFWGLCCLLCLKLWLKHSYLLCLNSIWVQLWHFHAPLFLHCTPHTQRITISCLVCYKNKWDLSNSTDIKKYWQILWGGNRWFFIKDYCKFRKTLMTL